MVLQPITRFVVYYVALTDEVEIRLTATETLPTGGQITIFGGMTTVEGGTLTVPAVFTTSKDGKSIRPS